MWNASCGVLPGRQEDGVKGGKGREVLSLTIAGYAWSRAEGIGHWNRYAHGRTEENRIQRAGVDVTLKAAKKKLAQSIRIVFCFLKCLTNTFSFHSDCRLSLLFY
jgi:hypothetical protein